MSTASPAATSHPVTTNIPKPLVFLCYTGADEPSITPFVAAVNRELKRLFIDTFFDETDIEFGESIPERIDQAMQNTGIALVFFSKGFFTREWPQKELQRFLERRNNNHDDLVIVPIFVNLNRERIQSVLPAELASIKYLNVHENCPFRVSKVVESVWNVYQSSFRDQLGQINGLPMVRGPNDELLYTCRAGDTLHSVAQGLLDACIRDQEILKANRMKHDEFVFGTNIIIPRFNTRTTPNLENPSADAALHLHIQEKSIEVWNDLVNVFRRIKGYSVEQISQALLQLGSNWSDRPLPSSTEEELEEGILLVLPKLTERKDGAILHLEVQSGDSYWAMAETITQMRGSCLTVPVEWQPNPDGANIFQPGATVSTHPSRDDRALSIWVCDDDTPESVMRTIEQLSKLDVNRLTNHFIESNPHLPSRDLQPGNVIVIKSIVNR